MNIDVLAELAGATVGRSLTRENPADVRSGTVTSFDAVTGVAFVLVDGDDGTSPLSVITGTPLSTGVRVMCLITKPQGGFVLGRVRGTPTYVTPATTGSTGSIGTGADQELARVQGPRLGAAAVQVAYTATFDAVANGNTTIVLAHAEVSLNGGTSWTVGPTFGVAFSGDNSRMQITVGASTAGGAESVVARVMAHAVLAAGVTPVSWWHVVHTLPRVILT